MLEQGEVLLTWQLLRDPTDPAGYPIPARRIGDHRKAYLTYEGPLTGDRGTVRRVEAGTVTFLQVGSDRWEFMLHGRLLSGSFQLTLHGITWLLQQTIEAE